MSGQDFQGQHPTDDGYDLTDMHVLHSVRPFVAKAGDPSAALLLGLDWAQSGEGTGMFLCRDTGPCEAPDRCSKTFWSDRPEKPKGHPVELPMPWSIDSSGELEVFKLWCCNKCHTEGTAAVFDVWIGRFYDLPARLLSYLNDKRGHTYSGLRRTMGAAYPDQFNEASFVTLALYRRTL